MYTLTITESYPGTGKTGYERSYNFDQMDRAFDVYAEQCKSAMDFCITCGAVYILSLASESRVLKQIEIKSTITK